MHSLTQISIDVPNVFRDFEIPVGSPPRQIPFRQRFLKSSTQLMQSPSPTHPVAEFRRTAWRHCQVESGGYLALRSTGRATYRGSDKTGTKCPVNSYQALINKEL